MRPFKSKMIKKDIDTDELRNLLFDFSTVHAVAETGALAGCPFQFSNDGSWEATPASPKFDMEGFREDITLSSTKGKFTLKKAVATRFEWNSGKVLGVSTQLSLLVADKQEDEAIVFRRFVKCNADITNRVTFPDCIVDPKTGMVAVSLLPIKTASITLDVFFWKEASCLIVEASTPGMDLERFRNTSGATCLFLSYLFGEPFDGDSFETVSRPNKELLEMHWFKGRSRSKSIYAPIPVAWAAWCLAKKQMSIPDDRRALDPEITSECFAKFMEKSALTTAIEYILMFPHAPVEMRGALLSVALESITDHFLKEGLIKTKKPIDDALWKILCKSLLDQLEDSKYGLNDEQKQILRVRIQNGNSPTNADKLTEPFKVLGVVLSQQELDAIKLRNDFLHEGRILDVAVVEGDREAWRKAYMVEMCLFTAINKLLLKYLGYKGPVFDWGAKPMLSTTPVFVEI